MLGSYRFLRGLPALLSAGLLVAACGGSDSSSDGSGAGATSGGGKGGGGGQSAGGSSAGGSGGSSAGSSAGGSGGSSGASAGSGGSSAGSGGSAGAAGSVSGAGGEGQSGQAGAAQAGAGGDSGAGGEGQSGAGGTSGAGGDAGAGGQSGGAGDGGSAGSGGCSPPCQDPQVCSVSGACIDAGTCLADGDCSNGLICNETTKKCEPGSSCGATKLVAEQVPPNMLIVLDRSCSMTGKAGAQTKWQAAVAAIKTLTTSFKDKIRFGLILFPDLVKPDCAQSGGPLVGVGPGKEAEIQSTLNSALQKADKYFPDGPCVTNIDTAMEQASKEAAFTDKDRKSFALLITDGQQSSGCTAAGGDKGTEGIIDKMHTAGVGTFVVGFSAGIDPKQLDKFAQLGGYPNPDPQIDHYRAEDEGGLTAALDTIAKQTLGCTFALQQDPPSDIYVFFDKTTQVAKDAKHQDGWDYDAASKQVTFYGSSCQALQSGSVQQLDIVFGCPNDNIPPPPGCESGKGCDVEHLCPSDPEKGEGLCQAGCCLYGKQ